LDGTNERTRVVSVSAHREVLSRIVATGELTIEEADLVQLAFKEAVEHVCRLKAPITCYKPGDIGMGLMSSRYDLMRQRDLLEDIATGGDVRLETIRSVREAIEQDIAFLEVFWAPCRKDDTCQVTVQALLEQFDQGSIEVSPDVETAALFLVGLLLKE
jgi:hypothetical protein